MNVAEPKSYPLSSAQAQLWFQSQLEGPTPTYNVPFSFLFTGPIDLEVLRDALIKVVERHEVLRSKFVPGVHSPAQVVMPVSCFQPVFRTIRAPTKAARHALAVEAAEHEARIPFDLTKAPLCRATILSLDDETTVLLFSVHHSVFDGSSIGVFLSELEEFHRALRSATEPNVLPLELQYRHFAIRQAQALRSGRLEDQAQYWRDTLQDLPQLLPWPLDKRRPEVQSYDGETEVFFIPQDVANGLSALGSQYGATQFSVLLAAFNALVHRQTGSMDFAIGTPMSNRMDQVFAGNIGYFVNTVALRTKVHAGMSFSELLVLTRNSVLGAMTNQELPFEHVVDAVQPERDPRYAPLVQTLFVYQGVPIDERAFDNLLFEPLRESQQDFGVAKFDLMLDVEPIGKGLKVEVVYNSALFVRSSIRRLGHQYLEILKDVIKRPDAPITRLQLISAEERQRILVDWNQTAQDDDKDQCIHSLFEAQKELTPEATAVRHGSDTVSYAELDARANQLAQLLVERGVQAETRVGICLPRSIDAIICVLAVLKAGGAFVGFDPEYSRSRLDAMTSRRVVDLLITSETCLVCVSGASDRVYFLDDLLNEAASLPAEVVQPDVTPSNLMQILFTSGSTGAPKAIEVLHGAWNNVLRWHYSTISRGTDTVGFFSISTDSFFTETFGSLCSGGTLHIIDEEMRFDSGLLMRYVRQQGIEKLNLPVVALQQMAVDLQNDSHLFDGLTDISVTGEQLHITDPVLRLFQKLRHCRLHNHYGPTETHATTYYTLPGKREDWVYHVPIGRPFPGCTTYVLNDVFEPVPIGTAGELYLGGCQLARGYFNNVEATESAFIKNPFPDDPSPRLYRTGDLVRYDENGIITFIDRLDNVMKIRGHRIEIDFIETILNECSLVQQAIVVADGDTAKDKSLVCFYVPKKTPDDQHLENFARQRLSHIEVPGLFVALKTFPLSPNKKIDRNALQKLIPTTQPGPSDGQEPLTEFERRVADIWKDLLGVDYVAHNDNFFYLGGNSLLVARLRQMVEEKLGPSYRFELRLLFMRPRLQEFCAELSKLGQNSLESVVSG